VFQGNSSCTGSATAATDGTDEPPSKTANEELPPLTESDWAMLKSLGERKGLIKGEILYTQVWEPIFDEMDVRIHKEEDTECLEPIAERWFNAREDWDHGEDVKCWIAYGKWRRSVKDEWKPKPYHRRPFEQSKGPGNQVSIRRKIASWKTKRLGWCKKLD